MKLRSPLSKAIGLGSARHGFSHWWWQRVSALALIPLVIWFVYSILSLLGADYAVVYSWLSNKLNATLMLILILAALFHGQTGLQVVIEDYIHSKWLNLPLLLLIKFSAVVLAVYATLSVFSVVLGG